MSADVGASESRAAAAYEQTQSSEAFPEAGAPPSQISTIK